MIEEILNQEITYSYIVPVKNYCKIDQKNKLQKQFTDYLDFVDEDIKDRGTKKVSTFEKLRRECIGFSYALPEKTKRSKDFFNSDDNSIQENFFLEYVYKNNYGVGFLTTSERHLKQHYGNPFSSITVTKIIRTIRKNGDVLTIKLFTSNNFRKFNKIYFKKEYHVKSISINLKTGDFIVRDSYKKSRGKVVTNFRKNTFSSLKNLFSSGGLLKISNDTIYGDDKLQDEIYNTFNDYEFMKIIKDYLGASYERKTKSIKYTDFENDLLDFFVKQKRIKVPNDKKLKWFEDFYPTEKFLKKNDRKLFSSILDMVGLKSKINIKLLHKFPETNLYGFFSFCKLFGTDYPKYIGNLNENVFTFTKSKDEPGYDKFRFLNESQYNFLLTPTEKENLIKVANSCGEYSDGEYDMYGTYSHEYIFSFSYVSLLVDHFKMIDQLREYDPDIVMKAKNINEFHREHRELSKLVSSIRKGWTTEYKFNEKMVEDVEKPINLTITNPLDETEKMSFTFYPKILKRDEEYSEEGTFMHHCVASYSDKQSSVIISLRNKMESDRVTCEYRGQTGQLIQARHFCNKQPPIEMEMAVNDILTPRVQKWAKLGLLHSSEKIKVPVKINGVEVKITTPTLPNMFPWEGIF